MTDELTNCQKSWQFILLSCIKNYGDNLKALIKESKMNERTVFRRLFILNKAGLIKKEQSHPFAIYKLTHLGERTDSFLIQSEKEGKLYKQLWDCHNLIVGFTIHSFGNFQFVNTNKRTMVQMNNWNYAREEIGDYVINVQDTKLLKIYCPRRTSTEPDVEFARMYSESTRIAQEYCNRYDMKISPMMVIRKGQKSLHNSEQFAKLFGRFKRDDCWIDASKGTEELEEPQDSNMIESLLQLPKLMNQLAVNQIEFSKNLMTHLEVLQKMSKSLDVMNEKLERLGK